MTSSSKVNMSPQAVVDGVYDGENSTVRVLGPGYGIKSGDLEDLAYIKIDLGQNKCIKDLMVFADGKLASTNLSIKVTGGKLALCEMRTCVTQGFRHQYH